MHNRRGDLPPIYAVDAKGSDDRRGDHHKSKDTSSGFLPGMEEEDEANIIQPEPPKPSTAAPTAIHTKHERPAYNKGVKDD